jgi:hypothetical protein
MVILFLVALLLAWPTMGLSIVAFIVFALLRGYLQAKAREHHANERQAERDINAGVSKLPSWMADRDKIEEFVNGAQRLAEHEGVPKLFSAMIMSNNDIVVNLMHLAGAMESRGSSFIEQQMAVAEKLIMLHSTAESQP